MEDVAIVDAVVDKEIELLNVNDTGSCPADVVDVVDPVAAAEVLFSASNTANVAVDMVV